MQSSPLDLAAILRPISIVEFLNSYWESKPLVIHRGDAGFYERLLTSSDLEGIISTADMRYPAIRLAKGGTYYPPQAYTTDITLGRLTFNGVPDVNRISMEYGKGATISLPYLHRTWTPLGALCAQFENALDYAAHANVYMTPGKAAGFPPHYDTHEVLVLQIAGKKKWLIDAPPLKLPHPSQDFASSGYTPGSRMMEIELAAGDVLYLPRGYVHSTTTSECHSAHVTIGINVLTWADLAWEWVPSCVQNEAYRRALPPGFASRPDLRPELKQHLTRLLREVSTDCDVLIDRAISVVQSGRQRSPTRFRADVIAIQANSVLQTPSKYRYGISQSDGHLIIEFDGRRFAFPKPMGDILEAMCAHATFRVVDLAGGDDTEAALTFARALQSIGFLQAERVAELIHPQVTDIERGLTP
jgi:hypothetical protein